MPKQIIISEQHHIAAVFSEDHIQELVVATGKQQVGDIYLGIVENVIPGIDAAFVNIGDAERNGFIHVSDLGPLRLKRSSGAITELLAPQQKALVQVMKEPTGNKGPRLTGNITLPGRYLVLMPYGGGVNLSRRIQNEGERSRLRALGILVKPAGMGLLVRTEAEGTSEEAIIEDLEQLQKQWESVQVQANGTRPPALLNRDDDFIQRVLRDIFSDEVNRIVADSHQGVKRIKQQLSSWNGGRNQKGVSIDQHKEKQPILEYFRVNAAIREALKPRVDLPSGGYIIIEPTEALTVIDVNSGSFTRSATARETVLWTNSEAATEIARQLKLRNIGGVIVVDFIDMDSRHDQLQLLEHFNRCLRSDKARPQIAQLSELGLVELTRKRQGQNLYELFGKPCDHCGGLGHLGNLPGSEDLQNLDPVLSVPAVSNRLVLPEISSEEPKLPKDTLELAPKVEPEEESLISHPSYQEQNSGSTNRRRRRRQKDSPREEAPTATTAPSAPPSKASRKEGDSDRSVEGPIILDRRDRREPRNGRREEPKETVVVEMTDLEQEIYALMGISPAVKVKPDVNPQSVIVEVRKPGEGAPIPPTASGEDGEHPDLQVQTPAPDTEGNPPGLTLPKIQVNTLSTSSRDPLGEPEEKAAVAVLEPELETPLPVLETAMENPPAIAEGEANPDPDSEEEDKPLVRRRRRRRSSASS